MRTHDLAGHIVDTKTAFPGGDEGAGFEDVRSYIRAHRQNDFVGNLCRKMLAYELGRSKLAMSGYRFSALVESIVTSPRFLTKRGPDFEEKGE